LLVLGTDGKWKQPVTFGRVQDDHTRPIVIIDEQNRNLYMFATAPVNGGTIYYKQAPLDRISFANGKGTPFIQSSADPTVNNATSTKQNVNSASGLVVLASDTNSKYYLHNTLNLTSNNVDTTAPTVSGVTPADAATGVAASDNVGATFSEDMDPSTLTASTFTLHKQDSTTTPVEATVNYDSAAKKATLDPASDLQANTSYTARVTGGSSGAKDLAGNALAQDYSWTFTTASPPAPSCTITGTANAETISGTSADDVICAGGGNDTIKGLGGNDTLKGEDGGDTLIGGVGNDTLDGGLGTDTASYSASLTAVNASLAANSATGEGSDTFLDVEDLLGSSKADTLTGSSANNKLTGGAGDDTEQGGSGNDTVQGNTGADTLKGEDGDDTVNSKDGVDGNDSLDGGAGTDTKVSDTTENSIVGFP
jgi:Ca2+-binding RTX toxin-like protein